ncbi:hypothetical protein RJO15_24010 [Herbaspirillum huttiense F1]|uniref:hypothetical protein n=1 Tax=Herbaspirillum huttiense TaxID=863372 RepID=UPI002884014E|nr:hypothetical protein [Herbaspirillum huttiense]MDT0358873.1 hypothetical protein [Herbaspirillum huttiense F1]
MNEFVKLATHQQKAVHLTSVQYEGKPWAARREIALKFIRVAPQQQSNSPRPETLRACCDAMPHPGDGRKSPVAAVLRRDATLHITSNPAAFPYIWQVFCFANSFILRL